MTHSAGAFCPACNRILHAHAHAHTNTHKHTPTHTCAQKVGEAESLEIRMMLSGLAGIYTSFLSPSSCLLSHSTFCLPPSVCFSVSFFFLSFSFCFFVIIGLHLSSFFFTGLQLNVVSFRSFLPDYSPATQRPASHLFTLLLWYFHTLLLFSPS